MKLIRVRKSDRQETSAEDLKKALKMKLYKVKCSDSARPVDKFVTLLRIAGEAEKLIPSGRGYRLSLNLAVENARKAAEAPFWDKQTGQDRASRINKLLDDSKRYFGGAVQSFPVIKSLKPKFESALEDLRKTALQASKEQGE